jgi:hypothetical protein
MLQDTENIIRGIADHFFVVPIEDYLLSEDFSRFCREQDLADAWREYLEIARDMPELYGSAVTKHAFVLFLRHIFHGQPEEFPALLGRLLAGLTEGFSREFPVDDLKKDLRHLGYSDEKTDRAFSILNSRDNDHRHRTTGCPR